MTALLVILSVAALLTVALAAASALILLANRLVGLSARESLADLAELFPWVWWVSVRHRTYRAYADLGVWEIRDVRTVHRAGWRPDTLAALPFRALLPSVATSISPAAYTALASLRDDAIERLTWSQMQQWYDAAGDLTGPAIRAGLSPQEAATLHANGRLDLDTLAAMAALRDPGT